MKLFDKLAPCLPSLLLLLFLLGALELACRAGWVNTTFVPPPSSIAVRAYQLVASGSFIEPLGHTTLMLVGGFAIGSAVAICLGVAMGSTAAIYNLLEPLVELLRPIPKPALIPPLILFLGLGSTMQLSIVALGTFFPVLINTVQGVRSVDPVMIDSARTFGYGTVSVWRRILLPASVPYILSGMRVSLAIALVMVILAEMLSGTGGMGDVILNAQRSFLVKESYAWLIILAVYGGALGLAFAVAERRLGFWVRS